MAVNPEGAAKNWQVESIKERLDLQDKLNQRIDDKLDRLLIVVQGLPTGEQLEGKISLVRAELQTEMKNGFEKQDLKYQPIVNRNTWLIRGLGTTAFMLVGSLILIVIGAFTK